MSPFNLPTTSIIGVFIALLGLIILALGFNRRIGFSGVIIETNPELHAISGPPRNPSLIFIGIVTMIFGIGVSLFPLWQNSTSVKPMPTPTLTLFPPTPTLSATVPPTPASGSIRLVHRGFNIRDDTTNTNPVTLSGPLTTGNLLVVAITQNSGTIVSVVDSQHDVFHAVADAITATDNNDYVELYYAVAANSGSDTITVTFTTTTDSNMGVYEYTGTATAPLDHVTSSTGMSTTPNGGTLTSTEDGELYFAVGLDDDGANLKPTAGMNYTLEDHSDNSVNERFYDEDRVANQGTYITDFAISTASSWGIIAASFKAA